MRTLPILFVGVLLAFQSPADDAKALFRPEELSEDPAAKANWKLTRTAPDEMDGPMPLILVHGLSTDFWSSFTS